MELTNNTVLITGGSSGLGLELARQLVDKGNKVLVCGRNEERLAAAAHTRPALHTFACDIASEQGRKALVSWVKASHPDCNVLVNNAAIVHKTDFYSDSHMAEKAAAELHTNLLAPMVLCRELLPVLEKNAHPAIVNITTGLALVPRVAYPIYNATKAGLRSFTMVLREQLRPHQISVTEVLMTVVDTPWHQGEAPKIAVSPRVAIEEMLAGLKRGQAEIRIGKVKVLALLARLAPGLAFRLINRVR